MPGVTDSAAQSAILAACRTLALPSIAAEAERLAQQAEILAVEMDERRLTRLLGQYARLDLVRLDEFGYLQLDSRGAELLFQILTPRPTHCAVW